MNHLKVSDVCKSWYASPKNFKGMTLVIKKHRKMQLTLMLTVNFQNKIWKFIWYQAIDSRASKHHLWRLWFSFTNMLFDSQNDLHWSWPSSFFFTKIIILKALILIYQYVVRFTEPFALIMSIFIIFINYHQFYHHKLFSSLFLYWYIRLVCISKLLHIKKFHTANIKISISTHTLTQAHTKTQIHKHTHTHTVIYSSKAPEIAQPIPIPKSYSRFRWAL